MLIRFIAHAIRAHLSVAVVKVAGINVINSVSLDESFFSGCANTTQNLAVAVNMDSAIVVVDINILTDFSFFLR